MGAIAVDKERRVVPRWRYTTDRIQSAEFSGDPRAKKPNTIDHSFLASKLDAWHSTKSAGTAIDLLCAHQSGLPTEEAKSAARWLLKHTKEMTPHVVMLARSSLGLPDLDQSVVTTGEGGQITDALVDAGQNVRVTKYRLRQDPRNSLAWLDLCRSYTILGLDEKAERCMRNALFLSPHHRHVIRAAVRFYLHIEQEDRAHHLLIKNRRTPYDPWLTAAELAVAQIIEVNPRYSRKGRHLVDSSGLPASHLSELRSALAMLDLYGGAHRKARQMFRASLNSPTENAVAQARWASARLSGIEISREAFALPKNHEARSWRALSENRWEDAFHECISWINDEPFSSRPALVGSFIGLTLLDEPEVAKQFALLGLKASPEDAILHNNHTVALAYLGELAEALDAFKCIPYPLPESIRPHVYVATAGLLKFRLGDVDGGREMYDTAEKLAPKKEVHTIRLFRLREELNANPAESKKIFAQFKLSELAQKDEYAKRLLDLLKPTESPSSQFSLSNYEFDDGLMIDRLEFLLHQKDSPLLLTG